MKNILTIYNYSPGDPHLGLLKMWLHQVHIFNDSGCEVLVLSKLREPQEVKEWHNFYQFTWKRLKPRRKQFYPILKRITDRFHSDTESCKKLKNRLKVLNHHNVRFKLFHLTRWPNPFIFLDVDAILFGSISKLIEASKDKPFIAVNHEEIPNHTEGKKPYLNGGVQIVSQPGYFSYEDFTKQTDALLCSGHEQALIYTHFTNRGYDYTHRDVDYRWNSCSGYNEIKNVNGKWVCLARGSNALDSVLKSNTISEGSYIMINHYWDEFKPWKIDCPMYREFIAKIEVVK